LKPGERSRCSDKLRAWRSGVRMSAGTVRFATLPSVEMGFGSHRPYYLMGSDGFSTEVKQPGRASYHSVPSNAEV